MRRAIVDLARLTENITRLGPGSVSVDLSRNAFGHGAAEVATKARELGVSHFTVRGKTEQENLCQLLPDLPVHVAPVDEAAVCELYGLTHGDALPVMTLTAHVVAVKAIKAGAGVSYGYTFRAPSDGWLALVPLGYGDGFIRALGNRARGHLSSGDALVAGRVAMDVHSLFTGDTPARRGEDVTYFGSHGQRASDLADLVSAPAPSITAALGPRIVREYRP